MYYKYKRNQIFGKRLRVPKNILKNIYYCTLSFTDFIKYDLEDKIPISCIREYDRKIVERFGIHKCKELDWELIKKEDYYRINFRNLLMSIDPQTENINATLYELVKDRLKPSDYPPKMQEVYSDRLLDITQTNDENLKNIIKRFNNGEIDLKEIINHWDLFKSKDLSYCLLKDEANKNHITDHTLKEFTLNYGNLASLMPYNKDIYTWISTITTLSKEEEKKKIIQQFTDDILNNTHRDPGDNRPPIQLTNEEYKEIFKYSSIEDYLNQLGASTMLIEELKTLPQDYIFNIPIPITQLFDDNVLYFIGKYGLKNVVDFDNECGHFFTNNNCEVLKLMYDMYLKYGSFEDKNEHYTDGHYTKNQFYKIMKNIIVLGPSNSHFVDKAPDYRKITGEFRVKNPELFISEEAPEELQKHFYTKSITPQLLIEHPEYIEYLNGKNLSSCFKALGLEVENRNKQINLVNIYEFLSNKVSFHDIINFITEYGDALEIIQNRSLNMEGINISTEDNLSQIQNKINEFLRKLIIEKRLTYPTQISKSLIKQYPSIFLDKNAPQELQEAFYSRTISSTFILSNPAYRDYLNGVDLEVLFKYMPVGMMPKNSTNEISSSGSFGYRRKYHQINFVNALKETFGEKDALDVMLLYGKYIEQIFEENKLKNFLYNPEFTQDGFLDELDKTILQNIIDGKMKYDENIPSHFKNNNPTLFLGSNVPQKMKDKFYNREFTLKDFNDNPELLNIFENTNIACAFSENMSWIIPLFNDSENFKTANDNRMKVISAYSKIQDVELQKAFKEYVMEFGTNIDVEKIEYVSEVLSRLSLSNSSEIFTFRKELATQILKSKNPLESLNKIEDVFIKNNIPTVGKIYSCFEILHPDFQGFNFESSMVSPVLKKASTTSKKVIVFSDLMKASFGSNNRSVNAYLKNIEFGSNLYESIKSGQVQLDSLGEAERKELTTFCNHLATLYNNTMKARKIN